MEADHPADRSKTQLSDFQTPSSERRAGSAFEHILPGRTLTMSFFNHLRKLILSLTLLLFALGTAGAGIGYAAHNLNDFSLTVHGVTIEMHGKSTLHQSLPMAKQKTTRPRKTSKP
jgi:hypothetical protein